MRTTETELLSLLTWRANALDLLLRVIVFVSLPGLGVYLYSLIQSQQIGLAIANSIGYMVMCCVYFGRRWPIRVRLAITLGSIYAIAVWDMWNTGLSGVGPIYLLSCTTLSALLLSRRSAISACIVCSLSLLAVLLMRSLGFYITPFDQAHLALNSLQLISIAVTTILTSSILMIVVFSLTNQLRASLSLAETALVVRQTMQSTLEQRVTERTSELREALHANRYLVEAVTNMATGMMVTDLSRPENPTLFVNPAFTKITGYTIQELQDQSSYRLLQGPETDPHVVEALAQVIAERRTAKVVIRNYRKDGSPFWNELVLSPVFDQDGHAIAYVGLQSDVSERVEQDRALRASEIDHRMLALEHARLYESARRQAEQIETLRQASIAVAATLDAETAIHQILEQLVHVIPHDSASVQLRRGDFSEVFGCRGFGHSQDIVGLRFPISGNMLHEAVYFHGEAQLVTETPGHPGFIGLANHVINSWLGLPLIVHDQVIGMLTLDSAQTGNFTVEHLRIGSLFAGQVAIALDHTQRFQREVRAHQRLTVLQQAVREIAAQSTAPGEIYATIHQATQKLMPADSFLITLIDPTRDEIDHVYMADRGKISPTQRKPLRGSFTDYMIRRNAALLISDFNKVEGYTFSQFGEDQESESGVAVLLRGRTRILGTIFAQSYQPAAYSEDDPALLELLATHVATALENANLFAEVERLATVDALTELPNRRSFFTRAAQEFSRARRNRQPISIIMLDVDHFKLVNDTHGHHIGDQTLHAVAATCKAWLRPSDVACRYGGEEIAIVLPETNLAGAARVAERIRREIAAIEVLAVSGTIHVTASLGVASSETTDTVDLSALLIQADAALYDAKQKGRNRVCSSSSSKAPSMETATNP